MDGRIVRVLHISDLHMRSAEGPQAERARLEAAFRWRVLGEKWTANLAELRKDHTRFDLVVFTGDLGDWGHATDYPRALAFLRDTCAALDVPLDRLFVIPGNHDIDRRTQAAAWRWVRSNIEEDPRAYSEWMAGLGPRELRRNRRRDLILERQQAFWTAVARDLGRPGLEPRNSPHGRLGYRQAVMLPGLCQPLHVIGLDTAWLAGDEHDSGKLRLTEHQVSLLTTEDGVPLPGFRLALMHHRLADLIDAADARRWITDRVDLLLHGHQHEPTTDVLQGPDHQLLVLATGCLYEGDEEHHYPNAYQVIDLALDNQARPRGAEVRFRGWSPRGLFWGDDTLLYHSARRGRLRLIRVGHSWCFDENPNEDNSKSFSQPGTHDSKRLCLRFIFGKYKGAEVQLPASGEIRIGRSTGVEVELADDKISRIHALIIVSYGSVTISDQGSSNGTFVNGELIKHATRLKVDDRILVGTSIIRLAIGIGTGTSLKSARQHFEATSNTRGVAIRRKHDGMSGVLEEVPIEDLLRLLYISEKSGILTVQTVSKLGQLRFARGEIFSVVIDKTKELSKREAFLQILTWRNGVFEFTPNTGIDAILIPDAIEGSTDQLLSDGLKILRRS